MRSSIKIDSRKKYILILGKDTTQGLEHTLFAGKIYSKNFAENDKIILLEFGL